MPLAFTSLSHGTVAFGFFNIKTHMLLLQRRFFFADHFCAAVVALASAGRGAQVELPCWRIISPSDVGDLHGAIAGQVLTGFIGATYARWPFPEAAQDFKQDPDGHGTREEAEELVLSVAEPEALDVSWSGSTILMGEIIFDLPGFTELILYVDRGGYPRWRDDRRPAYVAEMMAELHQGRLLR